LIFGGEIELPFKVGRGDSANSVNRLSGPVPVSRQLNAIINALI